MSKKGTKKRIRERMRAEQAEYDERMRRLRHRIRREGGIAAETEADREELTRRLRERIEGGYAADEPRRASS